MIKELLGLNIQYKYKIKHSEKTKVQDLAIKQLGVKNIYELKDRFEGHQFFDQILTKKYAEITLSRFFNEQINISLKTNNEHNLNINGVKKTGKIIGVPFDDYPIIPKGNYDCFIIAFVNLSIDEVWLIGYIDSSEITKLISSNDISPIFSKNHLGKLKDLKKIIPIPFN